MSEKLKVIAFDASSDFAHFRKPYATTSALTSAVPSRTTVCGLVGAIIGLQSGGYMSSRHMVRLSRPRLGVSVSLLAPVRKTRIQTNYCPMKRMPNPRIQIPVEFVKSPRYRIIVTSDDDWVEDRLCSMLSRSESHYTPCLGSSGLIATIDYLGRFTAHRADFPLEVNSWVPVDRELDLSFEDGREYLKEVITLDMDGERRVTSYAEVIYERKGRTVGVRSAPSGAWECEIAGRPWVFFLL